MIIYITTCSIYTDQFATVWCGDKPQFDKSTDSWHCQRGDNYSDKFKVTRQEARVIAGRRLKDYECVTIRTAEL